MKHSSYYIPRTNLNGLFWIHETQVPVQQKMCKSIDFGCFVEIIYSIFSIYSYNETQPTENLQIYDITSPYYEEIGDIHTNGEARGNDAHEEMDKDNIEEDQYETPHHYLELV